MPMRGELRSSAADLYYRRSVIEEVTVTNPELAMIALFCAVGLWLSFYFIHFFPDFGELATSLAIACAP